jgi:hypothetical protein
MTFGMLCGVQGMLQVRPKQLGLFLERDLCGYRRGVEQSTVAKAIEVESRFYGRVL